MGAAMHHSGDKGFVRDDRDIQIEPEQIAYGACHVDIQTRYFPIRAGDFIRGEVLSDC